jgi:hypothetical protein
MVEGKRVELALAAIGGLTPSEAVGWAPHHARAEWLAVVSALHAITDARISSRARFLTQTRATVDVFFEARAPNADAHFASCLIDVATRLGIPDAQRDVLRAVHSTLGSVAVTVTTACTEGGPMPELALMYGITDWDDAVRACTLVTDADAARGGAAMLGLLSATLRADEMMALRVAVQPDGVDVGALVI